MNFRLTAILFAVVLVLVAGLLVAVLVDDAPPGDAPLLDLARAKPEDVDSVDLVRAEPTEQKLSFIRVDKDKWELREPAGPQVEGFQVSGLVRELVALKPAVYPDTP